MTPYTPLVKLPSEHPDAAPADAGRQLYQDSELLALCRWAVAEFAGLNVLVNSACIQRRLQLTQPEWWEQTRLKIAYGFSQHASRASRAQLDELFTRMNQSGS